MKRLLEYIRCLWKPGRQCSPAELQTAFQRHYRSFRALLTANNNALEIMAEMEETLASGRPFGMTFVRGGCTALSANVYKMIKSLVTLADGKYDALHAKFEVISKQIEEALAKQPEVAEGPYILPMDQIDRNSVDQAGEKMANLGEIRNRVGLDTPEGFVITAAAAGYFLEANNFQDEINRRLQTLQENDLEALYTVSAAIQSLISRGPLPPDLDRDINLAYNHLATREGREILVAMRSSALGEDTGRVSFAGQYRTQLNVAPEFLGQTYKEILAGKYKSEAIVYRLQRGFRHQDVLMCVGVLAMVDAVVSGVTFSRLPEDSHSDRMSIHAVYGLASYAVEGSRPFVCYHVSRRPPHDILLREARSAAAERLDSSVPPPTDLLADSQLRELAGVAMLLEEHFGAPQDIEWSFDKTGKLFLLQSRPLSDMPLSATETAYTPSDSSDLPVARLAGGVMVSRGVACGPVHKVASSLDLLQFPDGAVLVIKVPYPEYAVLMNRAAAIISETGQAATHLATVAREFGIPAIFNLETAFDFLTNGELVTVDATARRVHQGKVDKLLGAQPPAKNLMADSPVFRLFKEVLGLLTPLNLTNPAAPFFTPAACETLHDITRFCHEKAVQEMFDFGSRYHFDDRAAKQLVVETPFQWWIINLDDGFSDQVDPASRVVSLKDIRSEPMLAIWRGMTAVEWAGPPPISLGGFGSIIFQSTMNPGLDPGVRSAMAQKSYFLISRNFCNMSVRLGYHFSLAEAFLSDFLTESYISFQFKGGAADERRRQLRVNLLAEILQQYDFRVVHQGDSLTARIEKQPLPYLKERLTVLGYLIIHTRQIDMVMGEESFHESFRQKVATDLAGILNNTN